MKYLFPAFIFFLVFCTRSSEDEDFSLNYSKWNRKNIRDYEFTLTYSCFCPHTRIGPHNIKVMNDTIASVNDLPYDPGTTGELMTISELFSYVRSAMSSDPYRQEVEYDQKFGYPGSASFDFSKNIADEEFGFRVTNFKENR